MKNVIDAILAARPELARLYSREELDQVLNDFLIRLESSAQVERATEDGR